VEAIKRRMALKLGEKPAPLIRANFL